MKNPIWKALPAILFLLVAVVVGVRRDWRPGPSPGAKASWSAASKMPTGMNEAGPVTAYYFHYTRRCETCRRLEAYTRDSLESAFAADLRDGRLVWKPVNLEDPGNGHFVKDYGLEYQSVVLVGGKSQGAWKKLDRVWQLVMDKPKFYRYVQDEYRSFRP